MSQTSMVRLPGTSSMTARVLSQKRSLIGFEIERIEEAMLDAEPLEQARGDAARRIVGIVGDQQDIAATQHGQQRGRQGGKPAGIEHGARSPGSSAVSASLSAHWVGAPRRP